MNCISYDVCSISFNHVTYFNITFQYNNFLRKCISLRNISIIRLDASGQSLFFNISFTNFIITTFSSLHLWFKILDNFWGSNKLLLKWWWCCYKDASTDDADGNAWSYLMQYVFLLIFHGCNVEMEMILRVWAKKMLLGEILKDLFHFTFLIS